MDPLLQELLAVDSVETFNFFSGGLQEILRGKRFDPNQMLYVASVLAHYAQLPRYSNEGMLAMTDLIEIFDLYILNQDTEFDSETLESVGSQVLLFAGFFRDRMSRKHNMTWYDRVGQSFYARASMYSRDMNKSQLFDNFSESFPVWTHVCRDLNRTLQENRFLLRLE